MRTMLLSVFFFPEHWQFGFQFPATYMMEGIIDFHHDIMAFLVFIIVFVLFLLCVLLGEFALSFRNPENCVLRFRPGFNITYNTQLETIWTIVPTVVLLIIALPSFALIYALDETVEPFVTVRVVGHQWYWSYEFPDRVRCWFTVGEIFPYLDACFDIGNFSGFFNNELPSFDDASLNLAAHLFTVINTGFCSGADFRLNFFYPGFSFNSYLIPTEDLLPGSFRLLEVTRRLVLPVQTTIRLLITSYDVLHSWAIPAFGVKVDAISGRLNEYFLHVNFLGIFYGQCSEICGVNHGFMPIKVEVVTYEQFCWWFITQSLVDGESIYVSGLSSFIRNRLPFVFLLQQLLVEFDFSKEQERNFLALLEEGDFTLVRLVFALIGVQVWDEK